ncbi:hypothetical protein BKA64DRAFT_613703 [Cadophora sp. MPI-SDFR-AT-0126]|nr:hypothetical protein BKA64DRAFT_613703 [Leotiomycetes sp. MPI-SDFR-AT-0126]
MSASDSSIQSSSESLNHFEPNATLQSYEFEPALARDGLSDLEKRPFVEEPHPTRLLTGFTCGCYSLLLFYIVGTILIIASILTQHINLSKSEVQDWPEVQGGSQMIVDCGSNPDEAKSKGCVWDLMNFAWTHPLCYNRAESEDWIETYGPWKWYLDSNATQPVADEDLPYTDAVYTEYGYHVEHCLYSLNLLILAATSGHLIADETSPLAHTHHCSRSLVHPDYVPYEQISTKIYLLYMRCMTLT